MKRVLIGLVVTCAMFSPSAVTAVTGAHGGSLSVSDPVNTSAQSIADGTSLSTKTVGGTALNGLVTQTLTTTWDPSQGTADPSGVVAPTGWTTEYTTDGSTWSASVPTPASDIRGVRATGTYNANGQSGGMQRLSSSGTGTVTVPAASFTGAAGGDGYDVTIAGPYVLNVFHHSATTNGKYNLDCHILLTGDSCGTMYQAIGYTTPQASSAAYVPSQEKVYSFVDKGGKTYVLCTNVASFPFSTCGDTLIANDGGGGLGSQVLIGDRLYAGVNHWNGSANVTLLLCADLSTTPVTACANQPYTLTDAAPLAGAFVPSWTTATQAAGSEPARVFVTSTSLANSPNPVVNCFVAATGSPCSGTWPVTFAATSYLYSPWMHAVVPRLNSSGEATGICALTLTATNTTSTTHLPCFNFSGGSAVAPPAGYYARVTTAYQSPEYAASYGSWGHNGTKQFWWSNSKAICYDWATDAACAGYTPPNINAARYAIVADPNNPNCMWSNGDNGIITQFSAIDGALTCPPVEAEVTYPYTTLVPRYSCTEPGRVRSWEDVTFTVPNGVTVTSLKATVRDSSGTPITGFVNIHPDVNGRVDLSGLNVNTSSTQPSILLLGPGVSVTNAGAITATIRYAGDGAELCVPIASIVECPQLAEGPQSSAAVPPGSMPINAIVHTVGGSTTTDTLLESVTRADVSGCVGNLDVDVSYVDGTFVPGTTVELVSGGVVLASGTTDAQGRVRFAHLAPSANYEVRIPGETKSAPVNASAVTNRSFVLPLPTPTPAPTTTTQTLSRESAAVLADEVRNVGRTVLVPHALTTNAGEKVRVKVTCEPRRKSVLPRGDVTLCRVKRTDQGRVSVRLPGTVATKILLKLTAPAAAGYPAMSELRTYLTSAVRSR